MLTTSVDENYERLLVTDSSPSSLNESNLTNICVKSPTQQINHKKIDINSLAE